MSVTGFVINEKLAVPKSYKMEIRQSIYYCKKYGVESHLSNISEDVSSEAYFRKLLGKVNYILSVEKDNEEMKEYKLWLTNQMKA